MKINTIEEALEDFRAGQFLIVVDDEDRENEGDFVIAAEKITPEKVNFMLQHGRGVLCSPITEERCAELGLIHQVQQNTSMLGTPFTVTVDYLPGCTTGVSAHDRAATIRALADPASHPDDFGRPGHINPLYAKSRGVLQRAGHTEAAVDLCRLSGLTPAAALIEIMNEDGTMARMPQLQQVAQEFGLKIITIKDLIAYRLEKESLLGGAGLCSVSPKDGLSGEAGLSSVSVSGLTGAAGLSLDSKELALIQRLCEYPAMVRTAGEDFSPAILCNYAYALACDFNSFYHDLSILNEPDETKRALRLLLAKNVAKVLCSSMALLGIEMPDRM